MLPLGKILGVALTGIIPAGIVISGIALGGDNPLDNPILHKFMNTKGFSGCNTFLSEDNKFALLFACYKTSVESDNQVSYYFYNAGTWEKALKLSSSNSGDIVLVTTDRGWTYRKIKEKNSNQLKNMPTIDLNTHCQLQVSGSSSKTIKCHSSGEAGYADDGEGVIFTLKEFKEK